MTTAPGDLEAGHGLAAVTLAAGEGRRLRPLSDLRPKALVPVAGVPLLDGALARLAPQAGSGPAHLAVNAHHHAGAVAAAVGGRAHLSVEAPEALGTAGALGALNGWLGGRDVLVTNADVWMPGGAGALEVLVAGWDHERCRLLCAPAPPGARVDFRSRDGRGLRYVGSALLPGALAAALPATPAGLYEVLWRALDARGRLDLVVAGGDDARTDGPQDGPRDGPQDGPQDGAPVAVDCGTPADYLRANLLATGGVSAVGTGAVVEGSLERCVVWDGAWVAPHEHLVDAVRAGDRATPVTVRAAPG